jgi:hypothetical protein
MSKKTNTHNEDAENLQKNTVEYSDQELLELRQRMKKFYQEEIEYLELQETFERLQANIEEHKVRRMTMLLRGAQLYAANQEAEQENEKSKHTLKKD